MAHARDPPRRLAADHDLAALYRDRAGRALEADEHPLEAAVCDLLGRPFPDPVELLVVLHEPWHRRLVQVRLGIGVLAHDHVALLEPQDPLGLEAERLRIEIGGLLEDRVPHVLGERTRKVELVAELADEADAQRERRHAGDRDVLRVEVGEAVGREVVVGDPLHRLAGVRAGDVDGSECSRHVGELDIHEPHRVPPREPLIDGVGTARGGRHVEGVVVDPGHDAVVHDPAGVAGEHAVAGAADLEVGEAIGVDAIEEGAGVGACDEDLAERRDVDQAERAVHVQCLCTGVGAVGVRPAPRSRPHHRAAHVLVAVMQRRALPGLLRRAREQAHRDGCVRRSSRCRADRVLVDPGRLRIDADRVRVTEPALAGSHRHRRVALGELDRVEALRDRVLQVLRRLVLAEADEALVATVAEDRARHRRLAESPGDGADRLNVLGQVGRDEDAAALVVLDPGPSLREQLVVRLRTARHDDEVGLDETAVDRNLRDLAALRLRFDRGVALLAEVDDVRDLDACGLEVGGGLEAAVVGCQDDGPLARPDREAVDEAAHGIGQHDADEVIAGEDERLLDDPARHDDAMGAVLDQEVAVGDRHHALLEQADRDRRREQLDARVDRVPAQLGGGADAVAVGEERAAHVVALVDHDDRLAGLRRGDRCLEPGLAAADHGDIDVAVLNVDALLARAVRVERAEACCAPQELLVERPELAGADERLVVEAGRREGAGELVGGLHQVVLERADVVLALDGGALAQRRRADAHARNPVDRHLAVRAMTRAADEPARPVVLEAPREDPLARGVQRRADRVSGKALPRLAVERKADRRVPINPLT